MSFGYRVLPLVVIAALLAYGVWDGADGWFGFTLGFGLGVFAGGFIGDWLAELRIPMVPFIALAVAVLVVCLGLSRFVPMSEVLGYFLFAMGAFMAFRMIFGRYVEGRRQQRVD